MKIGGFQPFTLTDYAGHVAAIVFTQGCNFRCPYRGTITVVRRFAVLLVELARELIVLHDKFGDGPLLGIRSRHVGRRLRFRRRLAVDMFPQKLLVLFQTFLGAILTEIEISVGVHQP